MRLDNSAFTLYQKCPLAYKERYVERHPLYPQGTLSADVPVDLIGIELDQPAAARDFGTRFHQLLHVYRAGLLGQPIPEFAPWPDPDIESECQSVWAAYLAHYPEEPLTLISAERTEVIRVPGTPHELIVKIDAVVRHRDGTIGPLDSKTEEAGSAYNEREPWAARTQASFYLWALEQLYPGEHITRMIVDVITKGNSKRGPVFRRMDDISRTPEELEDAIRNLVYVADSIERHKETGWWPSDRNKCKDGWKKCDFYPLHILGRDANLKLYRPAKAYLDV